jgi:nitrogen regulatory protein PII
MQREMIVMTDASLITCVVQRGKADEIVNAARGAGAQGATIFYGHGTGVRERLGILGLTVEAEKEIINIVVANEQLDHIFEKMYLAGELDTPGMGVIYVTSLDRIATYVPDEVLDKLV